MRTPHWLLNSSPSHMLMLHIKNCEACKGGSLSTTPLSRLRKSCNPFYVCGLLHLKHVYVAETAHWELTAVQDKHV